jgi:gamma-glutamyltranspeptidase/glutathione hydrolase
MVPALQFNRVRFMRILLALLLVFIVAAPAQGRSRAAAHPQVMVAAANPVAVDAGLRVLRAGGSAVDAAVAVQAALGLVEPQSSGIGGGAFMLYYDANTRAVTAYDGREVAPAAAGGDLFLKSDGAPMSFPEAVVSGRATGVPGAIAMLAMAHQDHGVRPWRTLFTDVERRAAAGFVVGPRLGRFIASGIPQAKAPDVIAYFSKPDGARIKAGDVVRNAAYASTLRRIALQGPYGLLRGPTAAAIVKRVSDDPLPGRMTLDDLAGYHPKRDAALCRPYRIYVVCGALPPSGGSATLQALGLLERTDIAGRGPDDPQAWLEIAEAERLMYADRDRYVGDPAFVQVPLAGLLDGPYLDKRARLIGATAGPAPAPGRPAGAANPPADATLEPGGTSHFVVVDARGNVVSMTTTVESVFGTGRMVGGFFLNNQLTDFSFSPRDRDGLPAANAVSGGKRPRSSMSPVIVLTRDGRFVAAIGSPGGAAIPSYVLKTLVGVLDWKLSIQQAINLPNLVARGGYFGGEADKFPPAVVQGLAAKGVVLRPGIGEDSGLHGVQSVEGRLVGGADPRREGVARGF